MTPAEAAPAEAVATAKSKVRFEGLWLLSPRADLAVVAVPYGLMLGAFLYSVITGQGPVGAANRLAVWSAQNLLGNGTHVILTFLLFVVRPDTLSATKGQSWRVLLGIPAMGVVVTGLYLLRQYDATAQVYVTAVIFGVFGLHHGIAQCRGWWSLHHLRARQAGLPAPAKRELSLMRALVPLSLTMILVRLMFLPETNAARDTAFIDVGQGVALPYATLLVLLLVWLGYWGSVFRAMLREPQVSGPRVLYLLAVASGQGLILVAPRWGTIILPGMHGIEYYLLSSRMMQQREGDRRAFPKAMIWPAMVLSMLPLFAIGLIAGLNGETTSATLGTTVLSRLAESPWWRLAVSLSLTCVLAHYWADALIYRFRIPDVRNVMLKRLGFAR